MVKLTEMFSLIPADFIQILWVSFDSRVVVVESVYSQIRIQSSTRQDKLVNIKIVTDI